MVLSLSAAPYHCTVQALHKLQEPRALVRCRQVDQKLVEQAIGDAQVRCKAEGGERSGEGAADKCSLGRGCRI